MEHISDALTSFDSQDFMGLNGFVWWYGVVEDRRDPLYLGRVKVRCIGFHTHDKSLIPTDDLPWAQVIQPITSAAISGIGTTPIGPLEGTHVFGFFRDGNEGQEPVVLGTCVGIPSTVANRYVGFFDPRKFDQRKKDPYPPLFVDRQSDGVRAKIFEHSDDPLTAKKEFFTGENSFKGATLTYVKDFTTDKVLAKVISSDGTELYSEQSYSPNPNENYMKFDTNGKLNYSLPSIPLLSQSKINLGKNDKSKHPFGEIIVQSNVINRSIEEARNGLHSELPMLLNNKNRTDGAKIWGVPRTCFDPEYPFNHVTYTESGHLFEMDDTPNHERVRLLHRSMSYLEYQNNGDKIDNVVGDAYYTTDASKFSHILGNDVQNIGGGLSLYLNTRLQKGNDGYIKVGDKSNFSIETIDGNITISAKGTLTLKGSKIETYTDGSDLIENRENVITRQNFRIKDSYETDIQSETFKVNAPSKIRMRGGSFNLNTSSGISLYTTYGDISMRSQSLSEEVIFGSLGTNSKTITTTLGSMKFSCLDPTPVTGGSFEFRIGPELGVGLVPAISNMKMDASEFNVTMNGPGSGFALKSQFGGFKLESLTGISLKDFAQIEMKTTGPGQSVISMDPLGFISIKNAKTSLYEILNEILIQIQTIYVGTGTGPSTTPINSAQFQAIQQKLNQLMKAA